MDFRPRRVHWHGCDLIISVECFDEAAEVLEAERGADAEGRGWNQVVGGFELPEGCLVVAPVQKLQAFLPERNRRVTVRPRRLSLDVTRGHDESGDRG